jgi:hypothetical protein
MSTIAKKADSLPVWDEGKGVSGFYGPNSVVYYQKNKDTAGYAYRAKSTYIASNIPPPEDANWEIDYTYASEWKADGKYKYGSRVYYFNGQYSYAYIASNRYFGGSGKPNEEVDEDGIRTWELEVTYLSTNYGWYNTGKVPTFLFPVRKVGGYLGGDRAWPYNVLHPEERYEGRYYYDYNGNQQSINGVLDAYLYEKNYIKKDWSDLNSKYQSYAYDNRTYRFVEDKLDSKGNSIPLKKGTHFAKWRKKNSESNGFTYTEDNPNPYANAESQFSFTIKYSFFGFYADYWDMNGFSIEMWPNIADDEFTLVPSTTIYANYFYWDYNQGIRYAPYPQFQGDGRDYTYGWSGNGGFPHPDGGTGGYGDAQPPDSECKASLAFTRYNPAFSDLNCTYCFNVHTQKYKWDPYDIYCEGPLPDRIPYVCDIGYNLVVDGIESVDFKKESATTKDDNFNCTDDTVTINGQTYIVTNRQNLVRSVQLGSEVDFSSYKVPMTSVNIGYAGFKIS